MPHKATIESLPRAFEMVKAMQADGLELGENYRPLGRQALQQRPCGPHPEQELSFQPECSTAIREWRLPRVHERFPTMFLLLIITKTNQL